MYLLLIHSFGKKSQAIFFTSALLYLLSGAKQIRLKIWLFTELLRIRERTGIELE